jgi:serine/threonine-protein kinase
MAPEQVKGFAIDHRADLFAVGATMFRLIAKRRLHEARTDSELLVKMATMPAPPLATVAPGTPQGLCMVVDRALAFDKERRYPDARTMQEDVRALRRAQTPPYAAARLAEGDLPGAGAPGMGAVAAQPAPPAGARPSRAERTEDDPAAPPSAVSPAPISVVAGGGAASATAMEPTTAAQAALGAELSLGAMPASTGVHAVSMAQPPMHAASMPGGPMSAASMPGGPLSSAYGSAAAQAAGAQAGRRPPTGAIVAGAGALLTVLLVLGLWWAWSDDKETDAETPVIELPAGGSAAPSTPTAPEPAAAPTPAADPGAGNPGAPPRSTSRPASTTPGGGPVGKPRKSPFEGISIPLPGFGGKKGKDKGRSND